MARLTRMPTHRMPRFGTRIAGDTKDSKHYTNIATCRDLDCQNRANSLFSLTLKQA